MFPPRRRAVRFEAVLILWQALVLLTVGVGHYEMTILEVPYFAVGDVHLAEGIVLAGLFGVTLCRRLHFFWGVVVVGRGNYTIQYIQHRKP